MCLHALRLTRGGIAFANQQGTQQWLDIHIDCGAKSLGMENAGYTNNMFGFWIDQLRMRDCGGGEGRTLRAKDC